MNSEIEAAILRVTDSSNLVVVEEIQALWSGYGQIVRVELDGVRRVVKHVKLPVSGSHPRGWNTDVSHDRKVRSYKVETRWYRDWSERCPITCRIPRCEAIESVGSEVVIILEDLDAEYPGRKQPPMRVDEVPIWMTRCLEWLAHFHAAFLGEVPTGLWEKGTYWHLATRPDEWDALDDAALKAAAASIDACLAHAQFQTLVHGDAKLANFCFSDTDAVAAVDFQYVGGGCGMKDVAYFLGSCLDDAACERHEEALLKHYFKALREAAPRTINRDALEAEWRELFPVAWADFHRFLKGWSPGHWKLTGYSERMTRSVVEALSDNSTP